MVVNGLWEAVREKGVLSFSEGLEGNMMMLAR